MTDTARKDETYFYVNFIFGVISAEVGYNSNH